MKKRYDALDIIRGIAIVAVILIHITSTSLDNVASGSLSEGFILFINQLSRFAVPAFLFLSGLGLTLSNKLNQGYFQFLWKQVSKIILLYFIWNIVYYLIVSSSPSLLGFIKSFILGTNYYHLYYVPIIIFFYVTYPLLVKLSKKNLWLIIFLLISVVSQFADVFTGKGAFNDPRNVFNWVFYFYLGIWAAHDWDMKVKKIINYKSVLTLFLIIGALVIFSESYLLYDVLGKTMSTTSMRPTVILLTATFIMFVLCIKWHDNLFKKSISKLSNFSYGIYLSHPIILTIFNKVYQMLGFSLGSLLYVATSFIIVAVLSIIVAIFIDRVIEIISGTFKKKSKTIEA